MNTNDIVEINGNSHYEIGFDHGTKFKKEINSLISDFYILVKDKLPFFKYFPPKWLVSCVGLLFSFKFPKKYLDEMKGIAKGSGLSLNTIIFINSFMDFGSILTSIKVVNMMEWGCSGFLTKDKDGKFILAKTFDAPVSEIFVKYGQLFYYNCKCLKQKFLIYTLPGGISGDYFIAENGTTGFFFYGGLGTAFRNYLTDQMTCVFFRELYENGNTFGEAKKYLEFVAKPLSPYIGLVCDGSDSAFRLDMYSKYKKRYDFKKQPLICTNYFLDTEIRKKSYMKGFENMVYYHDSIAREEVLRELVKDAISIDEAKEVLAYQTKKTYGSISNNSTTFAMIKTFADNKIFVNQDRVIPATLNKKYKELKIKWE